MTWKDARIVRRNSDYMLIFFDDEENIVCGGRFSTKADAENALDILLIISANVHSDRQITRKLQEIIDASDLDEEEPNLWF